jgi:hypothetical protein
MMSPIPIHSVMYLIQSGTSADLVLRLCINSINNLDNAYAGHGRQQQGSPKFRELIAAMVQNRREPPWTDSLLFWFKSCFYATI